MKRGVFRSARSVRSVTRDGVLGEVQAPALPEFGVRAFLDNPIRLDGLTFLSSLSTAAFDGTASYFLGGVASIRFFATPGDRPEARRFCCTRIVERVDGDAVCDVEAMDETGRVAERLTGVRKVLAKAPDVSASQEPIWVATREHPRLRDIRRLLGVEQDFALAQVRVAVVEAALEQDYERLLREHLNEEERKAFTALSHPKRRKEWLAGRVAAKAAVRMLLQQPPPFPGVHIESDSQGVPKVGLRGEDNCGFHASISHSGEVCVALAARSSGWGIDVEAAADSAREIADAFASAGEVERLRACGLGEGSVPLSALWSLKEACLKAAEAGNTVLGAIRLESARLDGDYLLCTLSTEGQSRLRGVAFVEDGYAYAVARRAATP
jgi:4'-phosphopantetheinyl transferase EntD